MEVTFSSPASPSARCTSAASPLWIGGHESAGVTAPSRDWFLAEGATGPFFETFVLFANPNRRRRGRRRDVPAGRRRAGRSRRRRCRPDGRLTVNIEGEDPALANAAVATQVTSTVPIIVERSRTMADRARSWYEAHNSFGVTAPARGGASRRPGGRAEGYQTYILLANPDPQRNVERDDHVPARERRACGQDVQRAAVEPIQRGREHDHEVPEIVAGASASRNPLVHPHRRRALDVREFRRSDLGVGTNATATRLPDLDPFNPVP